MFFEIEPITKSILFNFKSGLYAHIFPVTIYQYEAYLLSQNKASNLNKTPLIKLTRENYSSVFINNINLEEAISFSNWIGAKIPTFLEWDDKFLEASNNLFEMAFDFAKKNKNKIDSKIFHLLKFLNNENITYYQIYEEIGELCVEKKSLDYHGKIYLKSKIENKIEVVGNPAYKTRNKKFSFTFIKED